MFDGVGVVRAQTIHEFVEVVRQSLLGLPGCAISHGDQCGAVRSVPILLVLLAPLSGGAFVWIHALGLAFVTASAEDRSDRLLARGVVGGNVEQIAGSAGFQAAKLVDQGLAVCPRKECADDVCVDDIREGVSSLRKPMDVIL